VDHVLNRCEIRLSRQQNQAKHRIIPILTQESASQIAGVVKLCRGDSRAIDERFDLTRHPNESNRFGWVVEIDPFDPASTPVKRTALGRKHQESATCTLTRDGRLAVYMGDDSNFEYIYKFVSRDKVRPGQDAAARAANRDPLDEGTLHVARFEADGRGQWLALRHGHGGVDAASGFASQAEVLVHARQAADIVGATRMDRPEWIAIDPASGAVYVALTHNSLRGQPGRPPVEVAAAMLPFVSRATAPTVSCSASSCSLFSVTNTDSSIGSMPLLRAKSEAPACALRQRS